MSEYKWYQVQFLNVRRVYEDSACGRFNNIEEAKKFMNRNYLLLDLPMRIVEHVENVEVVFSTDDEELELEED